MSSQKNRQRMGMKITEYYYYNTPTMVPKSKDGSWNWGAFAHSSSAHRLKRPAFKFFQILDMLNFPGKTPTFPKLTHFRPGIMLCNGQITPNSVTHP